MANSKLTQKEMDKLVVLTRMSLTTEEKSQYIKQLDSILNYVKQISKVDTGDADFKTHIDIKNVFKDDTVCKSLNQDDAISQAKTKNGYIIIKRVING